MTRQPAKAAVMVLATVVLVSVVLAGYYRVGWTRMESACVDDAEGQRHSTVGLTWSWASPGFTCTYGDGGTRSSLWF